MEQAAAGFETVGNGIAEVSGAVGQVAGQVGNLPVNLNVNLDPVPVSDGFDTRRIRVPGCCTFDLPTSIQTKNIELDEVIPIPGLNQVITFFRNTFGFLIEVNHILTDIVKLVSITQEMGEIIQAGEEAVDQVLGVFRKWGTVVTLILVLTVVLLIIAYLEYLVLNLRKGWSMLVGRPAESS